MTSEFKLTCDQVLDEFAASADHPTPELVRTWMDRYPQFQQQIADFATEWVELLMAERLEPVVHDSAVVDKAMSRLQAMLREDAVASTPDPAQPVQARSRDELARQLGLDHTILLMIDAGCVLVQSIPLRIRQAFEAWSASPFGVAPAPVVVSARRAKAFTAPSQPITFRRAIELSKLSHDAKRRWYEELKEG